MLGLSPKENQRSLPSQLSQRAITISLGECKESAQKKAKAAITGDWNAIATQIEEADH